MDNPNLIPFSPNPVVRGGHLQTIVGHYLPSPKQLKGAKIYWVNVSGGDKVALCENRPNSKVTFQRVILLMHGLGGHADSPYMLRIAKLLQKRGWIVFRMNHRGCGQGGGHARQIYHSGRSEDASAVMLKIQEIYPRAPMIAVGFSLSGNVLLKLLGENKEPISNNLIGAIAVAAPIELSRCADALSQISNKAYDIRFVRLLKKAIKERQEKFADFPKFNLKFTWKIRDFDEVCTAPLGNFKSAQDYYTQCSAKQFLSRIRIPTYILVSDDDPFVPKESFANLPDTDFINFNMTRGGGHMGYICAEKTPLGSHRWLDYAVLTYAERLMKAQRTIINSRSER